MKSLNKLDATTPTHFYVEGGGLQIVVHFGHHKSGKKEKNQNPFKPIYWLGPTSNNHQAFYFKKKIIKKNELTPIIRKKLYINVR